VASKTCVLPDLGEVIDYACYCVPSIFKGGKLPSAIVAHKRDPYSCMFLFGIEDIVGTMKPKHGTRQSANIIKMILSGARKH
jgi:hypothetical protein